MATSTREEFKQWCLRDLGAPVINIDVTDEQIEDRIDEALEHFVRYHLYGNVEDYVKVQITPSHLYLTTEVTDSFHNEETVVGQTSGATAVVNPVTSKSSGTDLHAYNVDGEFIGGEVIKGKHSSFEATLISDAPVELGNFDLRYIELPDYIFAINEVMSIAEAKSVQDMFDIQYQMRITDMYNLSSFNLQQYELTMQYLDLLNMELNGHTKYRYSRIHNKLYLDINWRRHVAIGDYICIHCYHSAYPSEFPKVWNENWLKHYTVALIKRQWGSNLKKFTGMKMTGGIKIDGDKLYKEANEEIKDLDESLYKRQMPLGMYIG